MYLMYVDESGDTSTLEQGGSKVLIVTGCIINENDKQEIETKLREIKKKYYQNPDIEIKSNFLRYANPGITDPSKSSPMKLYDKNQYDALQLDIQQFLKTVPVTLISCVIDKKGYWRQYPSQNPYEIAYIFLLEQFQTFLENKDALGLCIIDPREGRVVDKKQMDRELNDTHQQMRWGKGGFWKPCPRIIEKVLFSDSELTVGIQIADLFCYPIFNVFEYNKKAGEYEWFDEISLPKLNGPELKFFPEETKKDFRFYE